MKKVKENSKDIFNYIFKEYILHTPKRSKRVLNVLENWLNRLNSFSDFAKYKNLRGDKTEIDHDNLMEQIGELFNHLSEHQVLLTLIEFELEAYLESVKRYGALEEDKKTFEENYFQHFNNIDYFKELGASKKTIKELEDLFYNSWPEYSFLFDKNPQIYYPWVPFYFKLKQPPTLSKKPHTGQVEKYWFIGVLFHLLKGSTGLTKKNTFIVIAALLWEIEKDPFTAGLIQKGFKKNINEDSLNCYLNNIIYSFIKESTLNTLKSYIEENKKKESCPSDSEKHFSMNSRPTDLEEGQFEIIQSEQTQSNETKGKMLQFKKSNSRLSIKEIRSNSLK